MNDKSYQKLYSQEKNDTKAVKLFQIITKGGNSMKKNMLIMFGDHVQC